MTKREQHERRIRELKFAMDLMNEDPEFYERILGGKENLQKWIDYRLMELKTAMNALEEEE